MFAGFCNAQELRRKAGYGKIYALVRKILPRQVWEDKNERENRTKGLRARRVLKNHYWLLLTVCLIGVVFGPSFPKDRS